ncbi:GspH/FimT family pseudopilin [Niveibacterium sp.]|uniref:GspH/FimT family pseudopilin n=1 Tax=Niveibacterium sp. TaxID=2017444 RepID=UPI0035AD810C
MFVRQRPFTGQSGFSLIELMVTLTVAGILLAIAIPPLTGALARQRISSTISDLSSDLALARSEAARVGQPVSVCASSDGTSCSTSWTNGWLVWVDVDGDGTKSSTETTIVRSRVSGRTTPTITEGGGATNIVFGASGALRSPARTWTVCVSGQIGRAISVLVGGPLSVYTTSAVCS